MTAKEARALNLAHLIRIKAKDNQRLFAETYGLNASHVSQMIGGHRNMGDELARKLEKSLKLPRGALDVPLEGDGGLNQQRADIDALGPFYAELGLYWPRITIKMQQAIVETARAAASVDTGRRSGPSDGGEHPRRRSGDDQMPHVPFSGGEPKRRMQ